MKSDFKRIIEKWIPQNTKVLDLGCGDGDLLEHLKDSKNVNGFGIEIDTVSYTHLTLPTICSV